MNPVLITSLTAGPVALGLAAIAWGKLRKRKPAVQWLGRSGLQQIGTYETNPITGLVTYTPLPGWENEPFFTKNLRLAAIARERAWLIENKAKVMASKKGFYSRLKALTNEELALEGMK